MLTALMTGALLAMEPGAEDEAELVVELVAEDEEVVVEVLRRGHQIVEKSIANNTLNDVIY